MNVQMRKILKKILTLGTSLVVQWLGPLTSTAKHTDSVPAGELRSWKSHSVAKYTNIDIGSQNDFMHSFQPVFTVLLLCARHLLGAEDPVVSRHGIPQHLCHSGTHSPGGMNTK